MKKQNWYLNLAYLVTTVVAVAAFAYSFEAQKSLAETYGVVGVSWLLPLIVDGGLIGMALTSVYRKNVGLDTKMFQVGTGFFVGISVLFNYIKGINAAGFVGLKEIASSFVTIEGVGLHLTAIAMSVIVPLTLFVMVEVLLKMTEAKKQEQEQHEKLASTKLVQTKAELGQTKAELDQTKANLSKNEAELSKVRSNLSKAEAELELLQTRWNKLNPMAQETIMYISGEVNETHRSIAEKYNVGHTKIGNLIQSLNGVGQDNY